MSLNELCVLAGGFLTLLMGLMHTRFPKLFLWHADFPKMTERNQRIVHTIHLALLLLFMLIGGLSIAYFHEIASAEGLSKGLLVILSLFWFWRMVWQLIYFKPSKNRRLKRFLVLHFLMTVWFLLLFIVYLIPIILT